MHELSVRHRLALLVGIAMASLLGRVVVAQLPQPSSQPPPQPPAQALPQPPGYSGQVISGQGPAMDMTDPRLRNPAMSPAPTGSSFPPVGNGIPRGDVTTMDCTSCHDRPAAPIGKNDSPGTGFDGESLSPRSWASWWEVRREPYLIEARSSRSNPIDRRTAPPEVIGALVSGAQSSSAVVRAEALLALGRVHAMDALELLTKATADSDSSAALRAWTAIGLLDTAPARQFLEAAPPAGSEARIGWTVAVGLLKEPTKAMWQTVRKQVDESEASAEAQRLAIWAMRLHRPEGTHDMLLRTIHTSTNRALVSEAIAGLPRFGNPNDLQFLADIVRGQGATANLRVLSQFGTDVTKALSPDTQDYYAPSETFSFDPDSLDSQGRESRVPQTPQARKVGQVRGEFLFVRESAVRALGEFETAGPDIRRAIGEPVLYGIRGFPRPFLPQDVLALAKIGNLDDYYGLSDRLEVQVLWHPGFPEPTPAERMRRPGRGNAAIAIGLLLDRLGGGVQNVPDMVPLQAPIPINNGRVPPAPARGRRAGALPRAPVARNGRSGRVIEVPQSPQFLVPRSNPDLVLYTSYRKLDETSELRSAAVMALAIGGQQQRAGDIKRSLADLRANDAPIFGYTMLALGLWGDPDLLPLAARQLQPAKETTAAALTQRISAIAPATMPLSQVLARRATAQALATLGDSRAIPLLIDQWGHSPAVDVELSRAIAWCRPGHASESTDLSGEFGQALANVLSKDLSGDRAASAAASLGALYDQDAIKRLNTLAMDETPLARGQPLEEGGKMNLKAPQRVVLGLANPHYFMTALAGKW